MLKKLRHIGVMVGNFDRTLKKFKGFGLPCTEIKEIKEIDARIGFLPIGESSLEIICQKGPIKEDDPMERVVRGQKGVLNHLCFEVDDLGSAIRDFERNGAKLVEGCPRPGAHGQVAFFYPETTEGVLIELCEV